MFDIGFFEIVVVGIVSLVVLGPEKLPGTIRTVSLWVGRLRRSFNNIKQDIEKEIGADEIRRQLRNEEIMERFKHTQSQVRNTISAVQKETEEFKKNIDLEANLAGQSSSAADTKPADIKPSADTAPALNTGSVSETKPAATTIKTDTTSKPEAAPAASTNPTSTSGDA